MDKCTFQITVTPDNITALREALLHVGVAFDPIKDMMAPTPRTSPVRISLGH